jgi:hypothetical protein
MKKSKSYQRLNKELLTILAELSNEAAQIDGYSHLSHTVKFDFFPSSLLVYCHFSDNQKLCVAQSHQIEKKLQKKLQKLLLSKGIVLKAPKTNLYFQS